jgi:ABC-type transport system substrate-binding protein
MSPASYKRWGKEEIRLHPVGTGPFKLARWDQHQAIVLEKNPHYYNPGLPYLDHVELRIMKDGITHVTALRAGEKEAATEEAFRQAGHDIQRYLAENMMIASIASVPFLQAARPHVKGYEHLHGFKVRFETTWLDK